MHRRCAYFDLIVCIDRLSNLSPKGIKGNSELLNIACAQTQLLVHMHAQSMEQNGTKTNTSPRTRLPKRQIRTKLQEPTKVLDCECTIAIETTVLPSAIDARPLDIVTTPTICISRLLIKTVQT